MSSSESDSGHESFSDSDSSSDATIFDTSSVWIKFTVVDENGSQMLYSIKKSTKLRTLKKSYADSIGVPIGSLQFFFEGRLIGDDDTAEVLEMENNDIIEVDQEDKQDDESD